MPWFRVDDGLANHEKTIAAGNAAMGLWVKAGSWCMGHLSDGRIPKHVVRNLGTMREANRLVAAGLWLDEGDHFRFEHWEEFQPTRKQVEEAREAAKHRQRRGRVTQKSQRESRRDYTVSHGGPIPIPEVPNGTSDTSEVADAPPDPPPDPPPRVDVERLCSHLADRVQANGAKRPDVSQRWREAARLMLDRDGRTEADLHRCIDWCQDHEFWRSNILSMPKLREKYEQLRLQAQRGQGFNREESNVARGIPETW